MERIGRPPNRLPEESTEEYIDRLLDYLNRLYDAMFQPGVSLIKTISQNDQPSVEDNQIIAWKDADGGPLYYLVVGLEGVDKKVQIT